MSQHASTAALRSAVVPCGPAPRLQPGRRRPRRPLIAAIDRLSIVVNRLLDRLPWVRALYSQQLRRLEITDVPLRIGAEHAGLHGLRIAFVADIHAGGFLGARDIGRLVDRVNELDVDLVCFGGDMINQREFELALFDWPLRRLRSRLGGFAVAGNHDHRWHSDVGEWQRFLEDRGVQVLANHGVRIERNGSTLWLGGVDDLTDGRPDMAAAFDGRRAGEPSVLLAHQPDHFLEATQYGVDLVLSGHTHGGQVKLFGWAPIAHTKHGYVAGSFTARDSHSRLHVSRGVGATVLPLRFGARPEISVVRIVAA